MSQTGEMMRDQNRSILQRSGKMRIFMWLFLVLIVALIMIVISLVNNPIKNPIPVNSRQMIVVRTPSWTASKGCLQRYERPSEDSDWEMIEHKISIILGRNGLGWGRGLHSIPDDGNPVKKEGDGKSPAGVFRLGNAFGFPTEEEIGDLKIPYRSVDEYLECIDDVDSDYYNRLVKNNAVDEIDWESSERIHRSPNAYHYAVMVEHNTDATQKGAGSCIFLHCVSLSGDSTAGCTTMSRAEMESLIKWLDTDNEPILVQVPESEYSRLKDQWNLPN